MQETTVLLVDDERIILDSIGRDLEEENCKVTKSSSGEDAVDLLKNSHFDFIITDLMMSGLDGFQILKEAKRKKPSISVIILTGYGDILSAIDALRLGADDFLHKPCDSEELIYRMSNCLARRELQKKVTMYEEILPICMYCKKIRDDRGKKRNQDQGEWLSIEEYFHRSKGIHFSHGCCPECYNTVTKEFAKQPSSTD